MLHALDRPALAQALDRHAEAAGVRIPVLIEVNIGAEPQKAGISPGEVREFVRDVAKLSGLLVCGLMAVMPVAENPETLRPLFRQMRVLFDQVQQDAVAETSVTELSMGMSGDWQIAAQEGATILRIGSAIFGDRSIAR